MKSNADKTESMYTVAHKDCICFINKLVKMSKKTFKKKLKKYLLSEMVAR